MWTRIIYCTFLSVVWCAKLPKPEAERPKHVDITLKAVGADLEVGIIAPFYGDVPPSAKNGSIKFEGQERAQMLLKNEDDDILSVEVGPHGHHQVSFFKIGKRFRYSLPMNLQTWIGNDEWKAAFTLPHAYLPNPISALSAFVFHGKSNTNSFWSLTEVVKKGPLNPFDPNHFQAIQLKSSNPHFNEGPLSEMWQYALRGILYYDLSLEKSGEKFPNEAFVTMQGFERGIEINVTAPLNIKNHPIDGAYLIFRNDVGEMTEIDLSPQKDIQIRTFLMKGVEIPNDILPSQTDLITEFYDKLWLSSLLLPPEFLPPRMSTANIFILYKQNEEQSYILRPTTHKSDYEILFNKYYEGHFRPLESNFLRRDNDKVSPFWKSLHEKANSETVISIQKHNFIDHAIIPEEVVSNSLLPRDEENLKSLKEDELPLAKSIEKSPKTSVNENIPQSKSKKNIEEEVALLLPTLVENNEEQKETDFSNFKVEINPEVRDHKMIAEKSSDKNMHIIMEKVLEDSKKLPEAQKQLLSGTLHIPVDDILNKKNKAEEKVNAAEIKFNDQPIAKEHDSIKEIVEPLKESKSEATIELDFGYDDIFTTVNSELDEEATTTESVLHVDDFMDTDEKIVPEQISLADDPAVLKHEEIVMKEKPVQQRNEPESDLIVYEVVEEPTKNLEKQEKPSTDAKQEIVSDNISEAAENEKRYDASILQENLDKSEISQILSDFLSGDHDELLAPVPQKSNIHEKKTEEKQDLKSNDQRSKSISHLDVRNTNQHNTHVKEKAPKSESFHKKGSKLSSSKDEEFKMKSGTDELNSRTFLFPPPHPICFTPGLTSDSERCNVFHECELKENSWEVYTWMCRTGTIFDAKRISCVPGRCL